MGATQNAQELLPTDLVNTKFYYSQKNIMGRTGEIAKWLKTNFKPFYYYYTS